MFYVNQPLIDLVWPVLVAGALGVAIFVSILGFWWVLPGTIWIVLILRIPLRLLGPVCATVACAGETALKRLHHVALFFLPFTAIILYALQKPT
jgi:hypothetical protein